MITDEAVLPKTIQDLILRLEELRAIRQEQNAANRRTNRKRKHVQRTVRTLVLAKTGGRCHICGGLLGKNWQADHVLAYRGNGQCSAENLLPAHTLCNHYRWNYLSEEFQWTLKIGVWARTLMRKSTTRLGR